MTIAFFSNVLNHHQVALCDELYRQNNGDFCFVETGELSETRRSMGFSRFDRPYVVSAKSDPKEALRLAMSADIALMGAESYTYLNARLKDAPGITFSYSERWFKKGLRNILSPTLLKLLGLYMRIGRKRRWYMLAAGAYLANDFAKLGMFRDRIYKWGYFPVYTYSDRSRYQGDTGMPVRILWVGRMIDWKRPELMIDLAKQLLADGCKFEMTMIGDGAMSAHIRSIISQSADLTSRIVLKGNLPNDKVLDEMAMSDIFCFTSTQQEGWGAVLGEAMACGCCPVASADAGATPYLVEDGINGRIFDTGNRRDFYEKVKNLIDDRAGLMRMGQAAQSTMRKDWNAEVAVREFLSLSKRLLAGSEIMTENGTLPASLASRINK